MKETIAEYAKIVIVMISFGLVCAFIFGGVWFNRLGTTLNGVENGLPEERQQTALELLEEREKPLLNVVGKTFKTGETVNLRSLIKSATTLSEDGESTISIVDRVVIKCDSKYFNKEAQTITPEQAGIYTVKYTVKDDFGFSSTVIIKLVVKD
jgi:hypothetical protein